MGSKQPKVTVMDEPTMPTPLAAGPLPSKEDALRQAIGHLQYVRYGIDCVKTGAQVPADVDLHTEAARIWALIAGSI